jgi:hypothetical protein
MMQQSITLETAGGLLQSLGTAQFTSRLWQWLHEVVDPSSYHMTALRFRRGSQQAVVEQLDVLFFAGEADPERNATGLVAVPAGYGVEAGSPVVAVHRTSAGPATGVIPQRYLPGYRIWTHDCPESLGEECSLLGCETDYVYLLSIFRNRHAPSFTLGELNRLRQTCHFLIPLLARHAQLSTPCITHRRICCCSTSTAACNWPVRSYPVANG